jgi:hypothetical protein
MEQTLELFQYHVKETYDAIYMLFPLVDPKTIFLTATLNDRNGIKYTVEILDKKYSVSVGVSTTPKIKGIPISRPAFYNIVANNRYWGDIRIQIYTKYKKGTAYRFIAFLMNKFRPYIIANKPKFNSGVGPSGDPYQDLNISEVRAGGINIVDKNF